MRFTIVSDSLTSFTGFAKQTRLLASELTRRGHEVLVIGRGDITRGEAWENCDFSKGPVELLTDSFFDTKTIEDLVTQSKPDVALFFRNAKYLHQFENSVLFSRFKTLLWYADENEVPALSDLSKTDGFPDHSLLPVSKLVAECVRPQKVAGVLYHGINFDDLPAPANKQKLRAIWSKRLGTSLTANEILLICAERNDVRKNWDATYALVGQIKNKLPLKTVRLLQLTSQTRKEPYYDLNLCARMYNVEGSVVDLSRHYGHVSDNDLYELLLLSDLRISCAGSEGFGLLSLETAALRVPQVTAKLRAFCEYLGEDNPQLVTPIRTALYPQDDFYYAAKAYAIPDIERMSERAIELLTNDAFRSSAVERSFQSVRAMCHFPDIANRLLEIAEHL